MTITRMIRCARCYIETNIVLVKMYEVKQSLKIRFTVWRMRESGSYSRVDRTFCVGRKCRPISNGIFGEQKPPSF